MSALRLTLARLYAARASASLRLTGADVAVAYLYDVAAQHAWAAYTSADNAMRRAIDTDGAMVLCTDAGAKLAIRSVHAINLATDYTAMAARVRECI